MKSAMIIIILFILTISANTNQNGCTTKQDKVSIFPTNNEILTWQIKSDFFDGADLTYTLNDTQQKEFQIIHPIEQTGRDQTNKNVATNIVATKALRISSSGFWLNTFAFLDQTEDEVYLNIAEGKDNKASPNFNQRYLITKRNNTQISCFDVDFITPQKYIVDCQQKKMEKEQIILENIFFVVTNDANIISYSEKAFFQTYKQRFIAQYSFTNGIGITHQYLFRFTPAYSINLESELAKDSLVEVYLISETGQPQNTNFVLDRAILAETIGVPQIDFSLVDYVLQPNGEIYLLDAFNGLYILKFQPNGEWDIQNIIYPKLGQALAFSVNSLIKEDETLVHVIVVQGYNYFILIEDLEFKYIYDLPFIQLEYPAYIRLSQDNVILRNENTIYLYHIDTENVQLNSRFTLNQKDAILLNPYLPDLVVISYLSSKRYTLSMGYLKYMGSSEAKPLRKIELIAHTSNGQKCSATISYQILNDRDIQLYKLSDTASPFPKTLVEGYTHRELLPQVSGPNQQYHLIQNQLEDTQVYGMINKRWVLNDDQIIWPKNVVFADVLVLQEQTQFYQIIQTDNFQLSIWLCEHHSIYEKEFTCAKEKIIDNLNLGVIVNKQTFTLWKHELNNIYFMYRDTEYSILIKYLYQGELKTWNKISYNTKEPSNRIKSFFFSENFFFVIKADDSILAYSTYSHDNEILATLDSTTLIPYGYTKNWKPQRLFGNRKLHPNLLFIVNQDNIVLVDFHNKFTFLQQFEFQQGLEVELAIGEDTFFIVYGESTQGANNGRIEEFDFSRLNNIFKTKTVQLYWYQITSPLTVDQSEENGRLFVRAYCKYSKKAHILVFNPDTLQHDSLYDAWEIPVQNIANDDKLIMTVDGDKQMFLYTFVNGQTILISELKTSVMTIQINLDATAQYMTKTDLNLEASNYNYPDETFNTVKIKNQVQFINTQSVIQIDNTKFEPFNNKVIINSNVLTKKIDLGAGWFSGQLVGIDLDCEQCENHISITNILELNNPKLFNGFEIRDLIKYDDFNNIFLATKGLIFTNSDNSFKAAYHFDLPSSSYKCYQAQVSADKLLIYALCEDKGQFSIYVTGCLSVTGCSPLGEKFKLEQSSKFQLIENDIMVVLHTDNLEYSEVDGRIVIYQLKKGLKNWNLEVLDVIATQTLNAQLKEPLEYFRPSDFTVIKQFTTYEQQTLYKLIISNSKSGILFYDFTLKNLKYEFQSVESLNLYNYLNYEVDQYAFENTHFLQIRLTEQPIYDKKQETIRFQLFVQTNNVAHYGISFNFKQAVNQFSTLIQSKQLDFVLNRYSNWPSVNKIATNGQYIAIPYFNDNSLLIGLYKKQGSVPNTILSGTYLQYFEGQFVSTLNLALFFDLNKKDLMYASELAGPLRSYSLIPSPIITFHNENGDLNSQTITVILQNDFNTGQTQFKLEIKPIDLQECKTKVTNIQIYPSTSEILQWQLSNGIFEGVGLKYSIDDNKDFTIVEPINQINTKQHATSIIGNVLSIKSLNSIMSWNGHFAFLDYSTAANGLYYTQVQKAIDEAPLFSEIIYVDPEAPTTRCFDFDYLDPELFDRFLMDCQLNEQSIIYLIDQKQIKAISKIKSQFQTYTSRWFNRFLSEDESYFVRVTPAFSHTEDGDVGKVSLVELFQYQQGEITLKSKIDNALLAKLLKKDKTDFMLVDYKVYHDGILYLLDQKLGLLKLQYNLKTKDWSLLDQLNFNLQQFVAFDISDYTNDQGVKSQHIVILSYNYFFILENNVILKVQDLDYFTTTYPQEIQLSQRSVFIKHDNTIFVYGFNEQSITLLDKQLLNGGFLVDKTEKQYLTITQKESNLLHFSQGALKYEFKSGQVKDGQIKISARSLNNQKCESNIKYSIIQSDDSNIYKKTDSVTPFPNSVDETTTIDLGELTSGPNQLYEIQTQTIKSERIVEEKDDQVQLIQNTLSDTKGLPSDTIFQSSIVLNQFNSIFKIVQLKDKKLAVYSSNLPKSGNAYEFRQVGQSIDLKVELNDQIFTIWEKQGDNLFFYFATLVNEHQINIYRVSLLNVILHKTIPVEEKETIISIYNQGQYLLILLKSGYTLVLEMKDFSLVNNINQTQLNGFTIEEKPQKFFGNRILKQNILFVQHESKIIIFNISGDNLTVLKTIEFTKNNQIYISAGKNTFFLVNNKELVEYNYENLLNIYKSKTVELFGYSIVNPIVATTQLSTGNLIIKTTKAEKIYLNIYRPQQTQHDMFYLAILLNGLKDTLNFTISVANNDQMMISVDHTSKQTINTIEQSPLLVFNPKFDDKTYLKQIDVTVIVKNQDDEKKQAKFIQKLKVLNLFTQLSIKNSNSSINTNSTTRVEFPVDTAIGQNIFTTLTTFYETKGDISLKSRVQPIINNTLFNYHINYGYPNDKQKTEIYLQAKNTLVIGINQGDEFSYIPAEYTLSDQYNCFRLDNYQNKFYSICNNGVENELVLSDCKNNKCQLIKSYIQIPNGNEVIAPYENYVIVLIYNPQNPQSQDGGYIILKIITEDTVLISKEVIKMNLNYIQNNINSKANNYRPSSMTGVGVQIDKDTYVYLLMLTISLDEMIFDNLVFKQGDIQPSGSSQISLKKLLNDYVSEETLFLSTKIISQAFVDNVLSVELVVLTSDSGSFQIMMRFQYDQEKMQFQNSQSKLIRTFVKYGNWKVLNYLTVDSTSIAVAYYNENKVVVGVYQFNKESSYVLITGGYQFQVSNLQDLSPLNFLMLLQSNYLFSGNPTDKGMTKYKLNPNNSIEIKEPQKQLSQNLSLKFSNDFSTIQQKIELTIIPNNNDDDDVSKGLGAVWIVLIVLGSLVCLGLMGYGYYKTQGPKDEEEGQFV